MLIHINSYQRNMEEDAANKSAGTYECTKFT